MSNQGYDTWILELRGLGLSTTEQIESETLEKQPLVNGSVYENSVGSSVSLGDGVLKIFFHFPNCTPRSIVLTSGIERCKKFSYHFLIF